MGYSIEELQQHFGVNSFDELMALFGEGGRYEGNSGWYDILRAAQDGDRITAYLPNPTISISGSFMRDSKGNIQVDMGGGYIVQESVFADFGGHRTGMTYQGRPVEYGMYLLGGDHWATPVSGTQAVVDTHTPCRTWDCQAVAYDLEGIGGSLLYNASLAGELPSGGLTTAGAITGLVVSQGASAAGLLHTMQGLSTGATSTADLTVAVTAVTIAPVPVAGSIMQFGQLVWDLIDPLVPD